MFKIAFYWVFDNVNVNLRKSEGFLTSVPCIPTINMVNRTHLLIKVPCFACSLPSCSLNWKVIG